MMKILLFKIKKLLGVLGAPTMDKRHWTTNDTNLLLSLKLEGFPFDYIAYKLKRKQSATERKYYELDLQRRKLYGDTI